MNCRKNLILILGFHKVIEEKLVIEVIMDQKVTKEMEVKREMLAKLDSEEKKVYLVNRVHG